MQTLLINVSLSGLSLNSIINLSPFYQILICVTHVLPLLRQFWDTFQTELANKYLYKAIIGGIRLKLSELQESDNEAQKIKTKGLKNGHKEVDGVLHY